MMSTGRLFALGGGLRAVLRIPATLELSLMLLVCWGSETVRKDGTLRGNSSLLELEGSSGVLASEDSSTEPGEAGLLSENSSGVSGAEPEPDIVAYWAPCRIPYLALLAHGLGPSARERFRNSRLLTGKSKMPAKVGEDAVMGDGVRRFLLCSAVG